MKKPSLKDVYKALKAAAFYAVNKTVDPDEAERRLQICANCPKVTEPRNAYDHMALSISGGKYLCGICGCGINLIVHTKEQLLHQDRDAEESQERPKACWYPQSKRYYEQPD